MPSVLVPVTGVGGVTVRVVEIVGVVVVGDSLVPAVLAVGVLVSLMGDVHSSLALVPVVLVPPVGVPLVEEVGVIAVIHGEMPAVGCVNMIMGGVGLVDRGRHGSCSSLVAVIDVNSGWLRRRGSVPWMTASRAMWLM